MARRNAFEWNSSLNMSTHGNVMDNEYHPDDFEFTNSPVDNVHETDLQTPDFTHVPDKKRKGKGRWTSNVWEIFTLVEIEDDRGQKVQKAQCKLCHSYLSYGESRSTGHLARHRDNHCPNRPIKEAQTGGPTMKQTTLNVGQQVGAFSYSAKEYRKSLAIYICQTEQPLSYAENPRYVKHIRHAFNPNFQAHSRHTVRRDIMHEFNIRKLEIKQYFQNYSGLLSFTSDMWTGCNGEGYICATTHFIDENWVMHKKILGFRNALYPHDGTNIFVAFWDILNDFDIGKKMHSITLDNASNNNKFTELLQQRMIPEHSGKLFHVRCACHVINIIVQAGLKIVSPKIEKIRNAIFLTRHASRQQAFFKICHHFGVAEKKFPLDVKTRWNSTYTMLKSITDYVPVIQTYLKQHFPNDYVEDSDFDIGYAFMNFLQVFKDATQLLSGTYYPTINLVLPQLYLISDVFKDHKDDPLFQEILKTMHEKLVKYWVPIPHAFVLAAVMDPRLQGWTGPTNFIEEIYSNLGHSFLQSDIDKYKWFLKDMFDYYKHKYGAPSSTSASSSTQSKDKGKKKDVYIMNHKRLAKNNELDIYLGIDYSVDYDPHMLSGMNVLQWWKERAKQYPVLSRLARDLLTAPASTVASESAFSAGGRVLTEKRSCLEDNILEAIICVKEWEDSSDRLQEYVAPENIDMNRLSVTGEDEITDVV